RRPAGLTDGPGNFAATLALALLILTSSAMAAEGPEVTATIQVQPAEVYVLGDDIPLIWNFTNQSTNSLAMLWEGCCRLNGKLSVTTGGEPVEILPPGASSFHTYSKAETLPPGQPMKFSSLLADWVRLPTGGEFELGGQYTGVLPNQTPQIPAGTELWRGTARATAARLKVLSVNDYLVQRPIRSRARGLEIQLSGPDRLPPVDAVTFTATFKNLTDAPLMLDWPGTFQLWLVDERGWRLTQAIKYLPVSAEKLALPPRGELRREFQLSSADLNGEPFGPLQLFLDLGADAEGTRRVPSTDLKVAWNLGPADTVALLNAAAGGSSAGMRNPPLKLLRQYLCALLPQLRELRAEDLDGDRARQLRDQLVLAGCVLPLAPKPGAVFLPLERSATGAWSVALPGAGCESITGLEAAVQIERIAGVRRHLGWDLTAELKPGSATRLGDLFSLAKSLAPQQDQLAGPLTWRIPQASGLATNQVQFPTALPAANMVLKIRETSNGPELAVARKTPQPGRPLWMNVFSKGELQTLQGEVIVGGAALENWLQSETGTLQPVVIADENLAAEAVLPLIRPLIERTLRIPIVSPEALP
ncbi:MAG TPA: hypothetical protein VLD18_09985, partial [Verrucomicrobiae bacterium]|nr:hypothetical protein [Verrucomicrobiae bacterium]